MSALTHFPEDFGAAPPRLRPPSERNQPMSLVHEIDYGTPRSKAETTVTLTIDGQRGDGARRHLDHARRDGNGHRDPEALRDRHARGVRLLPAVPGRDRGPRRHAGLLHHAGRAGHGGPHPDRAAEAAAPGRDGALHLRPSARLPDLLGQRRLRAAGHGRRGRPARGALRLRRRQPSRPGARTSRTRISPSIRRNASSARAACAPARRCRARSR